MKDSTFTPPSIPSAERRFSIAAALLSALGFLISLVSLYEHLMHASGLQTEPSFCNVSAQFNCDLVAQSEYAHLFGVPNAALGVAFYFFLFLLSVFSFNRILFGFLAFVDFILLSGSALVSFSIYLAYISKFVIGTWCLLCIALYVINLLIFLFALNARQYHLVSGIKGGLRSIIGFLLAISRPSTRQGKTALVSSIAYVIFAIPVVVGSALFASSLSNKASMEAAPQVLPLSDAKKTSLAQLWKNLKKNDLQINLGGGIDTDYFKGELDAPIQVVEFSDFECPACRNSFRVVEKLIADYKGKISFIPKNYPLDKECNKHLPNGMHKFACHSAELVRCAGEQGRFWQAYEWIFTVDSFEHIHSGATQESILKELNALPSDLNLDEKAFNECMDSNRQIKKIERDIETGEAVKLQGTPTFFVNGREIPLSKVDEVIRYLLNPQ